MRLEVQNFNEFFLERIKHQYKINPEFVEFCKSIVELFYYFQIDIDFLNEKWNFKSDTLEVLLELCKVFRIKTSSTNIKELQALVTKFGYLRNGSGTINDLIFVIRNYADSNLVIAKSVFPASVDVIIDNIADPEKMYDIQSFAAGGVKINAKISEGGVEIFPDGNAGQALLSGDNESYIELMDGNIIFTNNFTAL